MTRPTRSDALLSAYVDRELPPDEAARVAALVARDGATARRVAHLHELKAAVSIIGADATLPPLPDLPEGFVAHRRPGWAVAAVMLGAAASVAGLVGLVFLPPSGMDRAATLTSQVTGAMLTDPLVAQHDARAEQLQMVPERADALSAPHWLSGLLAANGLQLAHSAPLAPAAQIEAIHHVFVGANRCMLSLFELGTVDAAPHTLVLDSDGTLQTARWQMHGVGYAIVARDMNRARFATVAASIHAASQTRVPDRDDLFAAMATARQRCTV